MLQKNVESRKHLYTSLTGVIVITGVSYRARCPTHGFDVAPTVCLLAAVIVPLLTKRPYAKGPFTVKVDYGLMRSSLAKEEVHRKGDFETHTDTGAGGGAKV